MEEESELHKFKTKSGGQVQLGIMGICEIYKGQEWILYGPNLEIGLGQT